MDLFRRYKDAPAHIYLTYLMVKFVHLRKL